MTQGYRSQSPFNQQLKQTPASAVDKLHNEVSNYGYTNLQLGKQKVYLDFVKNEIWEVEGRFRRSWWYTGRLLVELRDKEKKLLEVQKYVDDYENELEKINLNITKLIGEVIAQAVSAAQP